MSLIAVAVAAAVGLGLVAGVQRVAPEVLRARSAPAVALLAVAAAAGGIAASGEPTGLWLLDAVYRGLFAALLTVAASRSRRDALLVATGIAALTTEGAALVAGFALLGVMAGAAIVDVRGRVLGAAVGAGLAQVLLRLSWPATHGITALLAGLAFVLVAASAVRQVRTRQRRRVRAIAGIAAAAGVALLLVFGLAALEARPSLRRAVDASEAALDASRAGDTQLAAQRFGDAAELFADADATLGSWWAQAVRALPVVSQHASAARILASTGEALANSGADVARRVDPQRAAPTGGQVDLAAVRSFADPLGDAVGALTTGRVRLADARSAWLAAPVASIVDELDDRLRDAIGDAAQAAQAARWAPGVLGGDGPRRYLLALTTPSELRASSGFIGMWGILTADNGRLRLGDVQPISRLYPRPGQPDHELHAPPDFVARYARRYRLGYFAQNAFVSPDFPTSAAVFADLHAQATAEQVDGVVAVDPVALAALLRLTGPVRVAGWPEPISAANAERVLLFDHYVRYADREVERDRFLGDVARAVFDRFTSTTLPGPATIARTLGPVARGRHLSLWSADEKAERLFRLVGADGAIAPLRRDFIGVVTQNATEAKIDWFLRRSLRWDVRYDPVNGMVTGTLDVTVRNTAPSSGLPAYVIGGDNTLVNAAGEKLRPSPGQSLLYVSVYTPLGLTDATLDGEPVALVPQSELGRNVYATVVLVPAHGTARLRLRLAGPLDLPGGYAVDLYRQPTVAPDDATVVIDGHARRVTLDRDRTVRASP